MDPLARALGLLNADTPWSPIDAPENWPRWSVLLPHVLAATDAFGLRSPATLQDSAAEDAASLFDGAARYLRVHGRFDDARPLAEHAASLAEALHGPDHDAVAKTLTTLAMIIHDQGDPGSARPLYERALAIRERLDADGPGVAAALNNFALVLHQLGDGAGARSSAERALAMTESQDDPYPPTLVVRLGNLAQILRELGEPETARPLAERALALAEEARSGSPISGSRAASPPAALQPRS